MQVKLFDMRKQIELVTKANIELDKIKNYLNANEAAFDSMDLKLHDVSYYLFDNFSDDFPLSVQEYESDDLFSWFCEQAYDDFMEYLKRMNITFTPYHIGRTSKFYLTKLVEHNRYGIFYQLTLGNLIDKLGYNDIAPDFTMEGYIDEDDKYLPDAMTNLEYIASGEFTRDIKKEFREVIVVNEYISDFKKNQVEYFKNWAEYYEEVCIEDKEKENAKEEKRKSILATFKEPFKSIYSRNIFDIDDLQVLANA